MFGCGGGLGGCGGFGACGGGCGGCGGCGGFGGKGSFGGGKKGGPKGGFSSKGGFGKALPGGGFEDEDRSRDWYCPQCKERNFVKRSGCYKCQTAKPPDKELQAARPPAPPPSGTTLNGMVKSYNRKGFGFLMVMGADYGQDVYYTREQLSPKLQTRDIPGQHVTFELMRYSDGKLSAHNIRPLGDTKDDAFGRAALGGNTFPVSHPDDDRSRDWICTKCSERNFVKRFECFKCNTPRTGTGTPVPSTPSAPSAPPRRALSPHAGARAIAAQLAGVAGRIGSRSRSRSRRRENSSDSAPSSSSSEEVKKSKGKKAKKQKAKNKKGDRSSSSSSSSASSDCRMGEPSAPAPGSDKKGSNPEVEKAKGEALEELMRLRSVEPKEVRMSDFRGLLRKWHPDKNPDRVEVATEVFQFLQKGKAILDGGSGTAASR